MCRVLGNLLHGDFRDESDKNQPLFWIDLKFSGKVVVGRPGSSGIVPPVHDYDFSQRVPLVNAR